MMLLLMLDAFVTVHPVCRLHCFMLKPFAQVREKANAKLSKTLPAAYSAAVKMATSGEGGRNHKPSDVFADN